MALTTQPLPQALSEPPVAILNISGGEKKKKTVPQKQCVFFWGSGSPGKKRGNQKDLYIKLLGKALLVCTERKALCESHNELATNLN